MRDSMDRAGLYRRRQQGRNGQEGMRAIEELEPDIVIVDINMPIMDGVEMMKQTHEAHPYSAIVLSGYSSFDYAKDAMKYGAIRLSAQAAEKGELCEADSRGQNAVRTTADVGVQAERTAVASKLLHRSGAAGQRHTRPCGVGPCWIMRRRIIRKRLRCRT